MNCNITKRYYDQAMLSSDFSKVYYYTILLDQTPDLMCSGGYSVDYDFNGQKSCKI